MLGADEHLQPAEAPDVYGGIPDVSNIPPGSVLGSLPSPPGSSQRLYNPYEGLESALDRRLSKGAYSLPDQPEFLFDEEATVHRRNWSENITYYTGTGYLGGDPLQPPVHMISHLCCCCKILTCTLHPGSCRHDIVTDMHLHEADVGCEIGSDGPQPIYHTGIELETTIFRFLGHCQHVVQASSLRLTFH